MHKLTRRELLAAGAVAVLSAGAVKAWQRLTYRDYWFFGERHGVTDRQLALSYLQESGITRVGLEGIPQGVVTPDVYQRIKREQEQSTAKVLALHSNIEKIFDQREFYSECAHLDELIQQSGQHSEARSTDIAQGMAALLDRVEDLYALANEQYGPGYGYLSPLLSAGYEVHGVEGMGEYRLAAKKYLFPEFEREVTLMFHSLADASLALRRFSDRALFDAGNKLDIQLRALKSLLSAYNFFHERPPLERNEQEAFDKEEEKCVLEQRSQTWMNYAVGHTPLMIISGNDHVPILQRIAQEQGKRYTVAHRA